jgi:hypothetical protein
MTSRVKEAELDKEKRRKLVMGDRHKTKSGGSFPNIQSQQHHKKTTKKRPHQCGIAI